jgi:hypothetical protein
MRVLRCPKCQGPLPGFAKYCANCGESLSMLEQSPDIHCDEDQLVPTVKLADRSRILKLPRFHRLTIGTGTTTQHRDTSRTATLVKARQSGSASGNAAVPPLQPINDEQEDGDDYGMQRNATWNKVVTYKTFRVPPAPLAPRPEKASPPALLRQVPRKMSRRIPTHLFSWISVLALIGLLLGGVFGIMMTLGRGIRQPANGKGLLSLQVTPTTVAQGGILALHGSSFSSSGRVGLTRDTNIALADTGGMNIIYTDKEGTFSDTVAVDPSWGAGPHIIHAEDAILHRSASFTVMITGQGAVLRPAHLLFSMYNIDLGSDDQATNSARTITLSNVGGGEISWQATATQPWLLISPQSGSFSSGQTMRITIAGDRSNLKVGPYSAGVIFSSNTGQTTLPVRMGVIPLQRGHEAVLQLTPDVLSFNATDGSRNRPGQIVTVSNPGRLPLQWDASNSVSGRSGWLAVYPQFGTVTKGNSQPVTISVDTSGLLPGVYSGWVTFTSQGPEPVINGRQTVYISLTIVPQCAIQVSPGGMTFTSAYLQPAPASQILKVGVTQGCTNRLHWNASVSTKDGVHWLSIATTSGMTPASPAVNVNVAGLKPGTYTGTVIFSSSAGTQILPVTYVMGQPPTPLLAITPTILTFNGVIGQPDPLPQTVTVTNSAGGTLNWYATTSTTGGAWLSVTPAEGSLGPRQSTTITVEAALLATFSTFSTAPYNGEITITGVNSLNHPVAGSPRYIPVSFVVQPSCAIALDSPALSFQGIIGQHDPAAQAVKITANGACTNALSWTATTATKPAGGTWLTTTPAKGTVSLTTPSVTNVGIVLAGLEAAPNYSGTVAITAVDSVTKKPVGIPQSVTVALTVQPLCTLQSPSPPAESFSAEPGLNPASQSFTIGVIGNCTGTVTVTPSVTMDSGTGWLAVSPASATLTGGQSTTFTVRVAAAKLSMGSPYTGSISLAAVEGGIAITGSPQAVGVTLNVLAPPTLKAGPGVSFNVATGMNAQPITIANTGGMPLNWTATLDPAAPSFISLSAVTGTNLVGSTSTPISVNATGLAGGSSYTTSVTITAVDEITGNVAAGSPATIPVTIAIAPPQMTLSQGGLTFTTTAGTNPTAQTIRIQNTGGNMLSWTVGKPSASWLSVTPNSGSDTSQQSSTITFNVNVAGLSPGPPYNATVVITPTTGAAVTVQVTLMVN